MQPVHIPPVKRIVVKIGTSLITLESSELDVGPISAIAGSIAVASRNGIDVVLVSSGAVGMGYRILGWEKEPRSVIDRQALAAVGQAPLMEVYSQLFASHGLQTAQILLTRPGLQDRSRYLNARHTVDRLLSLGIIPIVNENDTVVTEELQFGDNDRLAAIVAGKTQSQLLLLLTDVESVLDEQNQPVRRVHEISPTLIAAAKGPQSSRSKGGMKAKLKAAQEAMLMGVDCVITSGRIPGIVDQILTAHPRMCDLSEEPDPKTPGTWFISQSKGLAGRKRWILGCQSTKGKIVVDRGAKEALEQGNRSLLPSGVTGVFGEFKPGDPVGIQSNGEEDFAQGLANLSSDELLRFMGKSSKVVKEEIKREIRSTVAVHKDDLVLIPGVTTGPAPDLD